MRITRLAALTISISLILLSTSCSSGDSSPTSSSPTTTQVQSLFAPGSCSARVGPYASIEGARLDMQRLRNAGYQTSQQPIGQGGIISGWSNRRYYFNVFRCQPTTGRCLTASALTSDLAGLLQHLKQLL